MDDSSSDSSCYSHVENWATCAILKMCFSMLLTFDVNSWLWLKPQTEKREINVSNLLASRVLYYLDFTMVFRLLLAEDNMLLKRNKCCCFIIRYRAGKCCFCRCLFLTGRKKYFCDCPCVFLG